MNGINIEDSISVCVEAVSRENNLDDRINAAFRAIINYPCGNDVITASKFIIALTAVARCVPEQYAKLLVEICDDVPAFLRCGILEDISLLPYRAQEISDLMEVYKQVRDMERRFMHALGIELVQEL